MASETSDKSRLLTEASGPFHAQWAVEQLSTYGIHAFYDLGRLPPELAAMASIPIWLEEENDFDRAKKLLDRAFRATWLDRDDGLAPHCFGCGYDLRGHSSDGDCPECGYPFRSSTPTVRKCANIFCPRCHEELPGTFDQCWNCGHDLTGHGGAE